MLDNQTGTNPPVTPAVSAQAEKKLERDPKAQRFWEHLAFRRAVSAATLLFALVLFLWWLQIGA